MLSIMSFTGKLEGTLSSALALWVLGLTQYNEHKEDKVSLVQNGQTRWALFLMTTLAPALGYLLMLIPIRFYNITGKSHHEMMEAILERRRLQAAGENPDAPQDEKAE